MKGLLETVENRKGEVVADHNGKVRLVIRSDKYNDSWLFVESLQEGSWVDEIGFLFNEVNKIYHEDDVWEAYADVVYELTGDEKIYEEMFV